MFSLVRHLRHQGYDAYLIISKELGHFQPQADSINPIDKSIIIESKFDIDDILYQDVNSILRFVNQFDYLIACGNFIAQITNVGRKIDMVIPYGSDLYEIPFRKSLNLDKKSYSYLNTVELARKQKLGIENADFILFDVSNEEFEKLISTFKLKGKRVKMNSPFLYLNDFKDQERIDIDGLFELPKRLLKFKRDGFIVIFSHIRQSWKNPMDEWSYKGNERIIEAYKRLLNNYPSFKTKLILFEYGNDINESKNLINSLGIEESVIWVGLTNRAEILSAIRHIDVGICEIGNVSWFSYGAVYEIIAMGKPVIHNRHDELYNNLYPELYPMFSASNTDEVYGHLESLLNNPQYFSSIGHEAGLWFNKYAVERPLNFILDRIQASKKISLLDKILLWLGLNFRLIMNKFNFS